MPLTAQSTEKTNLAINKSTWNVGVSVFTTNKTDASLRSIAFLLSNFVRNELMRLNTHFLSERERLSIAKNAIEAKATEHIQKLIKLQKSRDALLFNINSSPENLNKAENDIASERMALEQLKQLSPLDVEVPESMPLSFLTPDNNSTVWNLGDYFPEMFREKHGLDLLISGNIVRVGNYFGITANAWTESGKISLWEGAGSNSEFSDIAHTIASEVRSTLLGREWASLEIAVEPPSATIVVNGENVGVGYWSNNALYPGLFNIEALKAGYSSDLVTKILTSGDQIRMSINMEELNTPSVFVRSIPSGVSVRMGTLWLGKTPLSIKIPDRTMPLTFELDGYRKRTVPFSPKTENLVVNMTGTTMDPMEKMKQARQQFNKSAFWFAVSIAPMILLDGIRANYNNMLQVASNSADRQEASTNYSIATGAYIGSFAVSGGLLTISLIRLSRFLKAAEELQE